METFATTNFISPIGQHGSRQWSSFSIKDFSGGLNTSDIGPSFTKLEFDTLSNLVIQNDGHLKTRGSIELWSSIVTSGVCAMLPAMLSYQTNDAAILGNRIAVSMTEDDDALWVATIGNTQSWITKYGIYEKYSTNQTAYTHTLLNYSGEMELEKYSLGNTTDIILAIDGNARRFNEDEISELGLAYPEYDSAFQEYAIISRSGALGSANTQTGITKSGTYYYKFSFVYDSDTNTKNGESNVQARPYSVDVSVPDDTSMKVYFSKVPDTPEGVVKINVYRSPPDHAEGPYKLVGYYDLEDDNTSDFEDNTDYLEEGIEAVIGDNTPPQLQFITVAGGRLFGFDRNIPTKLVWSNVGQPDVFEPTSFSYLRKSGTGVIEFRGKMFVFDSDNIYSTDAIEPQNLVRISSSGCISHGSIVNTGTGITWLGKDNVYTANFAEYYQDGDFPIPVGDNIKDTLESMTDNRKRWSKAHYNNGYYYLTLNVNGQYRSSETFVLNTMTRSWSTLDANISCFGTYKNDIIAGLRSNVSDGSNKLYIGWLAKLNQKNITDTIPSLRGTTLSSKQEDIAIHLKTRPIVIGQFSNKSVIASAGIGIYADTDSIQLFVSTEESATSVAFDSTELATGWSSNALHWAGDSGPYEDNQYYSNESTYVAVWGSRVSSYVNLHKRFSKTITGKSMVYEAYSDNAGRSEIYEIHTSVKEKEAPI